MKKSDVAGSKGKTLTSLRSKCLGCLKCSIGGCDIGGHISNVFSNMNMKAGVMVIGQNPGHVEVERGLPFVGPSGEFFDRAISEVLGVGRDAFYITNVVKCLRYNTRVLLGDGSTKTIAQLVREKYDGTVVSVGKNGNLEQKKVIGWYKTPIAGRRMFKLSYSNAKGNPCGSVGPTLTEDHPVKTRFGYKDVCELKEDDEIAIGEVAPNSYLKEFLCGTLLGDGCVVKNHLEITHSKKDSGYIDMKKRCLSGFGVVSEDIEIDLNGKKHFATRLRSHASRYFCEERSVWYQNGKKSVMHLAGLSDLALAIWYQDDGSVASHRKNSRVDLATNGFSSADVDHLCSLLCGRGIPAKRIYSAGWRVSIGVEGADAFYRAIARYVHPSMRRKLPEKYCSVNFVDVSRRCGVELYWAKNPIIKEVQVPEKSVYCLDVEGNHNFVVNGGVVVHNCFTNQNRSPHDNEIQNCRELLDEEIRVVNPSLIVTLGGPSLKAVAGVSGITKYRGSFITSLRYAVKVLPLWHPSPLNMNSSEKREQFFQDLLLVKPFLE